MIYSKRAVQSVFKENGMRIKRHWGQNFLIDKNNAQKICKTIRECVSNARIVWEIGPGLGALTLFIAENASEIILFEIDRGIVGLLEKKLLPMLGVSNAHVVTGDAAKTVPRWARECVQSPDIICGNLPYSTGMSMLIEVLRTQKVRVPVCVMLQREIVERMAAMPGDKRYGVSSVFVQSLYTVNLSYPVPRSAFYPRPHVDSLLCTLHPKKNTYAEEAYLQTLLTILKQAFRSRRKQLKNTLHPYVHTRFQNAEAALAAAQIDATHRAEQIRVQQYCILARLLSSGAMH